MNLWEDTEIASNYNKGIRLAFPYTAQQIEVFFHLIEGAGFEPGRFVELGCGDGLFSALLLERYPAASGVLVDISETMIQAARQKLARFGDKVTCMVCPLEDDGWIGKVQEKGPPELVFSSLAIHHLENPHKRSLYRTIFDLLAEGGLFINIEHVLPASDWVQKNNNRLFWKSVRDHYTQSNPDFSLDDAKAELQKHAHPVQNKLERMDTQLAWLEEAGFKDVDCYFKVFEICIFGGRKCKGS